MRCGRQTALMFFTFSSVRLAPIHSRVVKGVRLLFPPVRIELISRKVGAILLDVIMLDQLFAYPRISILSSRLDHCVEISAKSLLLPKKLEQKIHPRFKPLQSLILHFNADGWFLDSWLVFFRLTIMARFNCCFYVARTAGVTSFRWLDVRLRSLKFISERKICLCTCLSFVHKNHC